MRHWDRLNQSKEFLFPMSEAARNRYVRELGVLVEFLERKHMFSVATFGPGHRLHGVLDHIRKELVEVEKEPWALDEWIDIVILALDGAARQGHAPQAIVAALIDKWRKVESRDYPDWRTADADKAIEHVRTPEEQAAKGLPPIAHLPTPAPRPVIVDDYDGTNAYPDEN